MKKISLFAERVYKVVKDIPKGKTMSYGEVAKRAGNSGSARAVGTIMKNNFDKSVPCHRVVKSDGSLGEYNRTGGTEAKRKMLLKEGWKNSC